MSWHVKYSNSQIIFRWVTASIHGENPQASCSSPKHVLQNLYCKAATDLHWGSMTWNDLPPLTDDLTIRHLWVITSSVRRGRDAALDNGQVTLSDSVSHCTHLVLYPNVSGARLSSLDHQSLGFTSDTLQWAWKVIRQPRNCKQNSF